jgi:REP element-mobilizing transposase RayT
MPNHLHGIIVIGGDMPTKSTGTLRRAFTKFASSPGRDTPLRAPTTVRREAFGKPVSGSLATLLRLFKQAVTVQARARARAGDGVPPEFVRARHGVPLQVWQDNFYEHVIRNEKELNRIREYICNNPLRWAYDSENPARDPDVVDEIEDILGTEEGPDR